MIIGITGGSGTGKSSLAQALGRRVVNVDALYHELLETNEALRGELTAAFGTCVRKELAAIVFSDAAKLRVLDGIAAKYMIEAVNQALADGVGDVIIDAAVLFELGLEAKCDVTVAVLARHDLRVARVMARDGLTAERAAARIDAQKPDDFYVKSADIVVQNNGAPGDAAARVVTQLARANEKKVAIYGGTFDPPTLGHLDVIKRAAAMYDTLYVVALINELKTPTFSPAERVELLEAITADIPNVLVESYTGLLSEYAYIKKARYSVRGVRNGFDAEYERPMFEFNAQIAREEFGFELDTIFIPTTRDHADTSSGNVCRLLAGGAFRVAGKYLDGRILEKVIARFIVK